MAIVGSAQIRITPNTVGFRPGVRKALEGIKPIASTAGKDAGNAFSQSFERSLDKSMANIQRNMQQAGRDAGKSFAEGMQKGMEREIGATGDRAALSLERSFASSGSDAGNSFGSNFRRPVLQQMKETTRQVDRDTTKSYGNSGRSASRSFLRTLKNGLDSGTKDAAVKAYDAFVKLWAKGVTAGAAVGQLVGGLSSLVGSLYSVAAGAASAAASLVAVAGVMGAALQGGIALAVAFKGVGDALGAGFEAATKKSTKAANDNTAALRRVADARERLGRVYEDNARRMADADRRVADAERDLADAQVRLTSAQDGLNRAREEALEDLQQLGFAVEDAALSEQRAAIRLEETYAEFAAIQDLPVDSMARREAELAFKEAELGYRRAKDRASDLAKEQEYAAKTGVEGTGAYIGALEDVQDAEEGIIDAEEKLADARDNRNKVAIQNARALTDAQKALQRALEDANKAASAGADAADKYAEALAKLSPSAQEFVKYLVSMKDRFSEFKKVVQEPFFAEFNKPFQAMVESILPVLEAGLKRTSGIMGLLAAQLAGAVDKNAKGFGDAMEQNNDILQIFTRRGIDGMNFMDYMVRVFLRVWEALGPVTERFAKFLVYLADLADQALNTKEEVQELEDFFTRAGDRAAKFGEIIKHMGQLFGTLSEASSGATDTMLQYFSDSFKDMNDAAEENLDEISGMFDQMAENSMAILDFFGALALEFGKLGASESIEESFKILKDGSGETQGLIDSLADIFEVLMESGPNLAELINEIAYTLSLLTESGAMEAFFDTLTGIFQWINDILAAPAVQDFMKKIGPALGSLKAIALVMLGLPLIGKILLGPFVKIGRILNTLTGGKLLKVAKYFGTSLLNGVKTAASRLTGIGGKGSKAASSAGGMSPQALKQNSKATKGMSKFSRVMSKLSKPFGVISRLFGKFGPVVGKVTKVLGPLLRGLGTVFKVLIRFAGPIGLIIGVIMTLVQVFKWAYENVEWFRDAVDAVVSWFKSLPALIMGWFESVKEWLSSLWDGIGESFQAAIDWVERTWDSFAQWVQDIPAAIGEWLSGMWDAIWESLKTAWEFVRDLYVGYFTFIFSIPKRIWRGLSKMWDVITDALKTVWDRAVRGWGRIFDFIKGLPRRVWNGLSKMWNVITEKLGDVVQGVKGKFNDLIEWFKGVPGRIANNFKNLGNVIGRNIVGGLNTLYGWINDKVIGKINGVLDWFGVDATIGNLPKLRWQGFAEGGEVRGPGGPRDDKIPARLSNREYVIKASSAQRIGKGNLDHINKTGSLPRGGINWNPFDVIGNGLDFLKGGLSWIGSKALGPALEFLMEGVIGAVPKSFRNANIFTQAIFGGLQKVASIASSWGQKKTDEQAAERAKQNGTSAGAYTGPPGGWTYPLMSRFESYTFSGHRPPWAYDIRAPSGVGVRAASAGRVVTATDLGNTSYGKYIIVDHGGGVQTLYAHLSQFIRRSGATVKTGELIGISGYSGGVRPPGPGGAHLHFEVRPSSNTRAAMAARGVRLATGGVVKATPGGVMAMLAEGGKHERVEPLDRQGLSSRDRALIEVLSGGRGGSGSGPISVNVYLGETELRDMVRYEVVDSNGTLARNVSSGRRRY